MTAPAPTSNASLRQQNLSRLVIHVHRNGPTSRAELTQLTGLTRSAVGDLVGELVQLGWLNEELPPPNGRIGRPSPLVVPARRFGAVGISVDVDAVLVGLVGVGGEVLRRVRFDTHGPTTPARVARVARSVVDGFRAESEEVRELVGVGVSIPGLVRTGTGIVRLAPHLGWDDIDIASLLRHELGLPVNVGNDASLGAIAESRFGAARGAADVIFLAGRSSGIGGGVVIDGASLHGSSGYAAELGHTLVRSDGAACVCGRRGCLEAEVRMRDLLDVLGSTVLDQDELDIALGTARDPRVLNEVSRQIRLLSEGISTFIHMFNPSVVVLGGFLGSLLTVGRDRLSESISLSTIGGMGTTVRIERAALRSRLDIIGAAELAFDRVLTDPAAIRVPTDCD